MANEIQLTGVLNVFKDSLKIIETVSVRPDFNGSRYSAGVQIIGPTEEQIVIGSDVGSAGVYFIQNTDDTLNIEVGIVHSTTFVGFLKLKPGEVSVGRLDTLTLYAKASSSGGANLKFVVCED